MTTQGRHPDPEGRAREQLHERHAGGPAENRIRDRECLVHPFRMDSDTKTPKPAYNHAGSRDGRSLEASEAAGASRGDPKPNEVSSRAREGDA